MKKHDLMVNLFFLLTIVLAIVFFIFSKEIVFSSDSVVTTVQISVCGNGVKEGGEDCDTNDFGGVSCTSLGYTSGTLTCDAACDYVTSACIYTAPVIIGGGGGGSTVLLPTVTGVSFSGKAYPSSEVTVLKDGQIISMTMAGPDANFLVSLSNISAGNYIFALYTEDSQGLRSSLFTFQVYVTFGAISTVSGIFLSPTITADKVEVKKGDNLAIFGQTTPNSQVSILVNSSQDFFASASTDESGAYLYNFDTSVLEEGDHSTKSKVTLNSATSNYSTAIGFLVGDKNVSRQPGADCGNLRGDINCDGKVNLVDFSIAAYWYRRTNPPIRVDINGDGQVSLVDFSIMAYNWTG